MSKSMLRIEPLRKYLIALLLVAMLFPAGASGPALAATTAAGPASSANSRYNDASTPIHASLTIDRYPPLGQPATVTCRVSSTLDAPGTNVTIELPATAHLTDGNLTWQGDLAPGKPVSLLATVVFDAAGDATILCRALRPVDAKNSWGDLAALYLSVGQTESQSGFAPVAPANRIHLGDLKTAGSGHLLDEASVHSTPRLDDSGVPAPPAHSAIPGPQAPAPAPVAPSDTKPGAPPQQPLQGAAPQPAAPTTQAPAAAQPVVPDSLTVTGNWSYFDRNDVYTGAEEFLVELVRGDNYGHLAWCYTDLSGNYACGPVTNPGGVGVRTILHSWSNYNPNPDTLAVVNPDWGTSNAIGNTFSTQTGVVVFPDGTQNIGAWFVFNGDTYERAYWTQRDINDEWRYISFNGGGGQAGHTTVQWKIDSTDGTYYNPGGNVHLMGVDPLSTEGVVVKHEYGHNIMYNIYGNYMPPNPNCNPHTIQNAYSAGCGWTEGWADFIPTVVNNDPTFYWPSGASLDLEYPTWGTGGWDNGDWVEGRIAGAMWDIVDTHNDGDDTYSDGTFVNIWDVIYNSNADIFSQWWSSWLGRGHSNISWGPIMDLYQNTINYRSGPANDDFNSSALIGGVPYTVSGLNTANATTQGYDPNTTCGSITNPRQGRSVWYRYTPPITGNYNLNTVGSSYDTVLAVWTGAWGSLTSRGCDDDGGGSFTSSLYVTLYGGTTYYIEAMGYSSSSGGSLNLGVLLLAPPNDDFNLSVSASSSGSYADYENTTNATTAGDDPSFVCGVYFSGQGAHSVWYVINSPYKRVLTASTATSNFDTVLGVWTGNRGALSLAGCNDDYAGTLQSQTQVALQANTTYHIEALSYSSGNYGALNFSTALGPICPDFVNPAGVGVEDISLIASMWGQQQGPPYDYNGDGIITIYDIMQVTAMFGQNCLATMNPPESPVNPALKGR